MARGITLVAALLLALLPAEALAQRRVRVRPGWRMLPPPQAMRVEAPRAVPIQRVYGQTSGPNASLVAAGQRWGVMSLRTGQQHPDLQAAAEAHAAYQARVGRQGHQGFDRRYQQLRHVGRNVREVANESWPGQNEADAAEEMYNSWRQSSGHWRAVNGRCRYWGMGMSYRPQNRTWYACGLFAD